MKQQSLWVSLWAVIVSVLIPTMALAQTCELPANLPDMVLLGTDVSNRDYLPKDQMSLSGTHYYVAEQGGGGTELTITKHSDGIVITRAFLEPGVKPHLRSYRAQCQGSSFVIGEGFALQWVPDGLIWWEANSQSTALPNDMWYFMEAVPALP